MIIEINNVSKNFKEVQAVKNINFQVKKGEIFGLIGPDGAGKSTIIRMIATLLLPNSGNIKVDALDTKADMLEIRKILGYMPGKFSLYPDLTIEENLKLFASVFGTTVEENYETIKAIYMQIEKFKDRPAGKLSGGMKQKLALSCALVHKPILLLLDEPTTGVDPVSRKEFWDILLELKKSGMTIFVSTPYMDEAARCDRIALIDKGSIFSIDSPEGIINSFSKIIYKINISKNKELTKYELLTKFEKSNFQGHLYPAGENLHLVSEIEIDSGNFKKSIGIESKIELVKSNADIEDCFIDFARSHE